MKRILCLISMLLCAAMLLSSCASAGGALKMTDVFAKQTKKVSNVVSEATVLGEYDDFSVVDQSNTMLVARVRAESTDLYTSVKVFDIATGSCVLNVTEDSQFSYYAGIVNRHLLEVRQTDGLASANSVVQYYDANGKLVAAQPADTGIYAAAVTVDGDVLDNYFILDQSVYHLEKGEWKVIRKLGPAEAYTTAFDLKTEKYFYTYAMDSVLVYDNKLEPLIAWTLPENAVDSTMEALNGGKIFVQYKIALPSDAKKYDLYQSSKKYDVVTLLVDPQTGKETKIAVNYLLDYCYPKSQMEEEAELLTKKVQNVAGICEIKDGQLYKEKAVLLSNTGKVQCELNFSKNQMLFNDFYQINDDYIAVENAFGGVEIIKKNGTLVATVSDTVTMTSGFLFYNGTVYDFNMKELATCGKSCVIQKKYDNCLFISELKDGEIVYSRVDRSGASLVLAESIGSVYPSIDFSDGYYKMDEGGDSATRYGYFNENRVKIFETASALTEICSDSEGNILLTNDKDGKTQLVSFH
ncbi:MAG: hypothetical protein MJ082_04135 [Clostridia bacterium]|nr:hypothetical protein [Clostridia bacterium]